MPMKLKKVEIELQKWGEHKDKYLSSISYEGEAGEMKMTLDSKVSDALLVCIGEVITKFAAESACQIRDSIHQSIAEAKKSPAIDVKSL